MAAASIPGGSPQVRTTIQPVGFSTRLASATQPVVYEAEPSAGDAWAQGSAAPAP